MTRRKNHLYKRGNIYTFKFKDEDGRWREKYTGKRGREEAQKFRDDFLRDLSEGALPTEKADWTVEKAATLWVKQHSARSTSRKAKSNAQSYLHQLLKLLGHRRLRTITLDDLKNYQQQRSETVGGRPINIELGILVNVLKEENLWRKQMEQGFKRLTEPKSLIGQALTVEQLSHLESVALKKDSWRVAYFAEVLASNTGLRGCEIKRLRLCNVDMENRRVHLDRLGTKSDAGRRLIELNQAAGAAACKLLVRAQALGGCDPEHYLLPANLSRHTKCNDPLRGQAGFDATRHQQSWDTAWRNLRTAAAQEIVDAAKEEGRELTMEERKLVNVFERLRFHDLRHSFITLMAERGVPLPVVQAMVGHMSAAMVRYYTHISNRAAREAVELLDRKQVPVCEEFCEGGLRPSSSEAAKLLN